MVNIEYEIYKYIHETENCRYFQLISSSKTEDKNTCVLLSEKLQNMYIWYIHLYNVYYLLQTIKNIFKYVYRIIDKNKFYFDCIILKKDVVAFKYEI